MVTDLPAHLRGERALAVYFENMNLAVESVSLVREVGSLKRLLDIRTEALLRLEKAWVDYLGNPSTVEILDPSAGAVATLVDVDGDQAGAVESQSARFVIPHKKRPILRPSWFSPKTDALEFLETKFREADQAVLDRRRSGKFRATHVAFVTFEKMSSAVSSFV